MKIVELRLYSGKLITINMNFVSSFLEGHEKHVTDVFLVGETCALVVLATYEEFKALYIKAMENEVSVDNRWEDHYHSIGFSAKTGPTIKGENNG